MRITPPQANDVASRLDRTARAGTGADVQTTAVETSRARQQRDTDRFEIGAQSGAREDVARLTRLAHAAIDESGNDLRFYRQPMNPGAAFDRHRPDGGADGFFSFPGICGIAATASMIHNLHQDPSYAGDLREVPVPKTMEEAPSAMAAHAPLAPTATESMLDLARREGRTNTGESFTAEAIGYHAIRNGCVAKVWHTREEHGSDAVGREMTKEASYQRTKDVLLSLLRHGPTMVAYQVDENGNPAPDRVDDRSHFAVVTSAFSDPETGTEYVTAKHGWGTGDFRHNGENCHVWRLEDLIGSMNADKTNYYRPELNDTLLDQAIPHSQQLAPMPADTAGENPSLWADTRGISYAMFQILPRGREADFPSTGVLAGGEVMDASHLAAYEKKQDVLRTQLAQRFGN